jgi:triacylglycerol lipase
VTSPPLHLPGPPFDLDRARTCGALIGEAYRISQAWEKDRVEPEAFEWSPAKTLTDFRFADPLVGFRDGVAYVALRGTSTPEDLITDLRLGQADYAIPGCEGFGRVHAGFFALWSAIREAILAALAAEKPAEIVVGGHSMGAAVSTLAVPDLVVNAAPAKLVHYAFGSPRVGTPAFATASHALAAERGWKSAITYRFANSEDAITHAPPSVRDRLIGDDTLWEHVGVPIGFSANYGSIGRNHHFSRCYLHAIEHPDAPRSSE